jgi:hypothetical protein
MRRRWACRWWRAGRGGPAGDGGRARGHGSGAADRLASQQGDRRAGGGRAAGFEEEHGGGLREKSGRGRGRGRGERRAAPSPLPPPSPLPSLSTASYANAIQPSTPSTPAATSTPSTPAASSPTSSGPRGRGRRGAHSLSRPLSPSRALQATSSLQEASIIKWVAGAGRVSVICYRPRETRSIVQGLLFDESTHCLPLSKTLPPSPARASLNRDTHERAPDHDGRCRCRGDRLARGRALPASPPSRACRPLPSHTPAHLPASTLKSS